MTLLRQEEHEVRVFEGALALQQWEEGDPDADCESGKYQISAMSVWDNLHNKQPYQGFYSHNQGLSLEG